MKKCTCCGEVKALDAFQVRRASGDGRTSSCKACLSKRDAARAMLPHRVMAREAYQKTESGQAAVRRAKSAYSDRNREVIRLKARVENLTPDRLARQRAVRAAYMRSDRGRSSQASTNARHPDRRAARVVVSNALRDGSLEPWPACAIPSCDCKPEAHHPDYSRPRDVVWICHGHHKQLHTEHAEYLRQKGDDAPL